MTAYVELIIADNLILTYLISSLSFRANQMRTKRLRCIIAAVIGTAIALVYPFVKSVFLLWIMRLGLWVVLSAVLFTGTGRLMSGALTFLMITLIFGGAMFALNFLFTGSIDSAMSQNALSIPFSVIFGGALIGYMLVKRLLLTLKKSRDAKASVMRFSLTLLGKRYELKGLMDTGNRLYDEKSGLPVVIVSARALVGKMDESALLALTGGRGETLQREARYLRLSTVAGGVSSILLLKPDEFSLYLGADKHKMNEVMVGVSFSPLRDSVEYDAVLHPSLM